MICVMVEALLIAAGMKPGFQARVKNFCCQGVRDVD